MVITGHTFYQHSDRIFESAVSPISAHATEMRMSKTPVSALINNDWDHAEFAERREGLVVHPARQLALFDQMH
jgi:hypothetical protein